MRRLHTSLSILIATLALVGQVAQAQTAAPPALPPLPSATPSGANPAVPPPLPLPMPTPTPTPGSTTPVAPATDMPNPPSAASSKPPSAIEGLLNKVNPALPDQAAASPEAPALQDFSYGSATTSVLFLPTQIERMKETIRTYEITNRDAKPATFAVPQTVAPVMEKVVEPVSYPVFYLSSIVFDAPGDWSLWVSGHKITSRKNDTDVKVINVSRDGATFLWRPSYQEAIKRRRAANNFASTETVKNRLAAVQNISQDDKTGAITFTLRPNQAFAVAYFQTFEGYIDSPKLEPLTIQVGGGSPLPNPMPGAMPDGFDRQGMLPPGMPGVVLNPNAAAQMNPQAGHTQSDIPQPLPPQPMPPAGLVPTP